MTETTSVHHEPSQSEAEPIINLIHRLAAPGGPVSAVLYSMASDTRPQAIIQRQHDAMSSIEAGLAKFYGEAIRSNRVFTPVSTITRAVTYPWPRTPEAISEVEQIINAVLADPAAQETVQDLTGHMAQTTIAEESGREEQELLHRIEALEQIVEQLQASTGVSAVNSDSRWRVKIAVFCLLQGILLTLAPVLDSNHFAWLCNLVAMAFLVKESENHHGSTEELREPIAVDRSFTA